MPFSPPIFEAGPKQAFSEPPQAATHGATDSLEWRYSVLADYAWGWEIWEDEQGVFQYVSPDCVDVCGYPAAAFLENPALFTDIIVGADKPIWAEHRQEAQSQWGLHHAEFRIQRADGVVIWLAHHCRPVLDDAQQFLGYRSYNEDITERRQMQEQLRRSEERYRWILESTSDILCVYDMEDECFTFVSPTVERVRGITQDQALAETWQDAVTEPFYPRLTATLTKQYAVFQANGHCDGQFVLELQQPDKDGRPLWVELAARFRRGRQGQVELVGSTRSIAERKQAEEQMEQLMFRDALTHLYNRRFFEEELQRMDNHFNMPVSILMGDINGLRLINEAFGHSQGDTLLQITADILAACARPQDVVARTSGDEFCILMPKTDGSAARKVLAAIEQRIASEKSGMLEQFAYVTWSFGVGTKKRLDDSLIGARQAAAKEMERQKLLEQASTHNAAIASLKAAMFARSEETEAHCQRMFQMARLVGLELGLSQQALHDLQLLCQLHDIGKIGVDDAILKKPGKLTADEWARMKEHPSIGARIAASLPDIAGIAPAIAAHHERWDGSGYPQGLRATEIPVLARILAVIDAYDAMTHTRIYREALPRAEAIGELIRNSGSQFDPTVVDVFLRNVLHYDRPVNLPDQANNQR